jgi:hypothetical protein
MGKAIASTTSQKETASKSKHEVGEPLQKEDKGMEEGLPSEEEVLEFDDTDTDEEEVAARWNNGRGP